MVTFLLLVAPAIRKLRGQADPDWPVVRAALVEELALDNYRPEFHRATVRWSASANDGLGGFVATSTGRQVSSRLLSMRTANALLCLPVGEGKVPAGSLVDALVIGAL
jgi:gephyrin